jgi:hypothetical protein
VAVLAQQITAEKRKLSTEEGKAKKCDDDASWFIGLTFSTRLRDWVAELQAARSRLLRQTGDVSDAASTLAELERRRLEVSSSVTVRRAYRRYPS